MKPFIKLLFAFFILVQIASSKLLIAQPFIKEIKAFQIADSILMPPKKAILFAGSSSFRLWKTIQADFPGYTIINRGFGGSALPDVIRYREEILFPYHPKQVVIYCGENDFAIDPKLPSDSVVERFKTLFKMIRERFKKTNITYVSMKPSPSRWKMKDQMMAANEGIKTYLKSQRRTNYLDIWGPMLAENGEPMKDLFLSDNLHMNAKGYAIWKEAITHFLIK
ncbi:GDSL-type esterase/lipase family protein [Sediminibacterium sp.]|uniref:GDSL-type esterase/lipase family protein n=1 Tax=Sediminibacterium sp. TaxID=1917865 RepID=UPI0025E89529|nr:GDSL-type esterase/lipase family protein [Sediminibacterium sp.]